MALLTRIIAALSLNLLVATTTIAQEPAPENANANSTAQSEFKKKRLPGNGPYIYRFCITQFADQWTQVLPFRSTYSTAEELMANRPNLRNCVKA